MQQKLSYFAVPQVSHRSGDAPEQMKKWKSSMSFILQTKYRRSASRSFLPGNRHVASLA
jgi:hypothetical protein